MIPTGTPMRGWLEDNREGLRLHRQLTDTAWEWNVLNRDPDLLYRGARLTQAQEWAAANKDEMNQLEQEFLDASISGSQREAAEREAQRQRELEAARKLAESEKQRAEQQAQSAAQLDRRARYLTGAFIIVLIMAFTALFFGSQARRTAITAQNDKRIATSRELAAASLNNLNVDPERSILLALHRFNHSISRWNGTSVILSITSLNARPIRLTLTGHKTKYFAAFSPVASSLPRLGMMEHPSWDQTLANCCACRTTKPSDLFTEQRIAYSPDGKVLAGCDSNQLRVYDPASGKLLMTLSGHEGDVISVTFSFDGKYLATGSVDTTVRIWDASNGELIRVLNGHSAEVGGLGFSPDGNLLFTSSEDGMLIIWDVETGELLRRLPEFTVFKVSFSPECVSPPEANAERCGTRVAAATLMDYKSGRTRRLGIHFSGTQPGDTHNLGRWLRGLQPGWEMAGRHQLEHRKRECSKVVGCHHRSGVAYIGWSYGLARGFGIQPGWKTIGEHEP
jgi:hypothetical protein